MLGAAIAVLSSLRLTVTLLGLCMILIFVATLVQVEWGIYEVQELHFRAWIAWFDVAPGEKEFMVPFPGGMLLGSLLLLNLLAAHARLRASGRSIDAALASMEPEAFVQRVLFERMGAREVWTGEDFRFGRARRGDAAMLAQLGESLGFSANCIDTHEQAGGRVSSSAVRSALGRSPSNQSTAAYTTMPAAMHTARCAIRRERDAATHASSGPSSTSITATMASVARLTCSDKRHHPGAGW